MRNKQFIYFFLLLISMIVIAAPAIPHHHHGDGIVCMKDDITEDNCCSTRHNHHHQSDDPCCDDYCTANFQTVVPVSGLDELQPEFQYTIILFAESLISFPGYPEEKNTDSDVYPEFLHGTYLQRAIGLRAPPCLI